MTDRVGPTRRKSTESSRRRERRGGDSRPHTEDPDRRRDDPDRTLRGLIGSGGSRLPPAVAMRARDVARPTELDLAEAEAELVVRYARPLQNKPAPLPSVLGRRSRHGSAAATASAATADPAGTTDSGTATDTGVTPREPQAD